MSAPDHRRRWNFPADWYTEVVRIRSTGTDARGNPAPVQRAAVSDCMIAPRATTDPVDWSDVLDNTAVLYRQSFDPVFESGDLVEVPAGQRMAGTWRVAGRPGQWPLGLEVPLERA